MNQRPKRTDSEQDIIDMQNAFLAEKAKNKKFQPAAEAVRIDKAKKQSLFAKTRNLSDKNDSKTNNLPATHVILGDIIEKTVELRFNPDPPERMDIDSNAKGFPKVERINLRKSVAGKSLFAMSLERKRSKAYPSSDDGPSTKSLKDNYFPASVREQESNTAKTIHEENLELLRQMREEDILAERAKLLESMDPSILHFLKQKRKQKLSKDNATKPQLETLNENMSHKIDQTTPISDIPSVAEALNDSEAENWVHFDVLEREKFEWMKDVPIKIKQLKPGESFEARFDWKGVLLPYTEQQADSENRELYLHGEEPYRPGYTLQELFRLCRSNVIQQRISAFGAISGILNIYHQGFYDNVLELPVTKIFFLLRFGFDENSPAILEVVSKALATLFYNDTDEILLDLISETSEGYLQPIMAPDTLNKPSEENESIENTFSKMKITRSPFSAEVEEDEEESTTSMNDFQLAETNLIECLLRSNIVQRISYILGTVRPQNSTVLSCLKILIRIARTNKDACVQIVANEGLLKTLFDDFLPDIEAIGTETETDLYQFPQYLVLKFFRVMLSQHISLSIKLFALGLGDRLKSYLYCKEDIKAKLIKVQIESFRILRSVMLLNESVSLYRELFPAFRYMLEWHYQHVKFDEGGSFLIRQHASALLCAIYSGPIRDAIPIFGDVLVLCCCKWFHEATRLGIKEFSQTTLLATCINSAVRFIRFDAKLFREFTDKYLRQFLISKSFLDCQSTLSRLSILLKPFHDRRNTHLPLPNLGSILLADGSPQLIISQVYPVYFLGTILKIAEQLLSTGDSILITSLMQPEITENLTDFLKKLSKNTNQRLATSFYAKTEIIFAFKLLCFKPIRELLPKEIVLQSVFNILCCMTSEHMEEIDYLFKEIIFTEENLNLDQNVLSQWGQIYLETFIYPHRIVISPTDVSLSLQCSQFPILPPDWPYLLLKTLLNQYLLEMSPTAIHEELEFPEKDIISITLRFTSLLEQNGLEVTSPTEKLMYLMISFMGPNSQFLEADMKSLLSESVKSFFTRCKDIEFQFNAIFEGKSKFENLYVLFLDHFQAASYGDNTFSALVLVPLAQKYDDKWRKMVWSEHAAVLRFLNCDENQLLGTINDYLYPIEKEESLIKCYARALNSNLLRANTIPYRIALHHVNSYKPSQT